MYIGRVTLRFLPSLRPDADELLDLGPDKSCSAGVSTAIGNGRVTGLVLVREAGVEVTTLLVVVVGGDDDDLDPTTLWPGKPLQVEPVVVNVLSLFRSKYSNFMEGIMRRTRVCPCCQTLYRLRLIGRRRRPRYQKMVTLSSLSGFGRRGKPGGEDMGG